MSLENLYSDNEKKEKERKSREKNEAFFESQKIYSESSRLLQDLARKISLEFWLDISEVKSYIQGDAFENLSELKNTLWEVIDREKFQKAVDRAKNIIEQRSIEERKELMEVLHEKSQHDPESYQYHLSEKYFWKYRLKALNPQWIWDQFLWVWLGIIDTTEAVILFLYGLWKWILLTPYHLYLIISGKGKFTDWEKI